MTDIRSQLERALADRYRLERELGQGGMAIVYLAHDLRHDREVAIKVLRPELAAILGGERFLREIRIAARLDHPHILTLIDSGDADGVPYYVLPYARGESLRDRLARERQLPIDDAVAIACQVAGALDHAHRQGVIHRDIKPENILLHEGEAMIADFGIALAVREAAGARLTESGLSLGTPQYMSPEQATADREIDARTDIYSLGAVLYEMIAGEPPVTGPTVQVIIARLLTQRPARLRTLRDTVPEHVDAAVAKALSAVPADRFGSAGAFARALAPERAEAEVPVTAARRLNAWRWAAGGAAGLVAAAVAWYALGRRGPPAAGTYTDRRQITFTGNAAFPALSRDGGTLAYVVRDCSSGACRYGIEVKDLAGGGARRIVDGAFIIDRIEWSPDGRFLLFPAQFGAHVGEYVVPVLGGQPRRVSSGFASFYPGTDSLLVTPSAGAGGSSWLRILTPDGVQHDSIPVSSVPGQLLGAFMLPGRRWVLLGTLTDAGTKGVIIDRHGTVNALTGIDQNSDAAGQPGRIVGSDVWSEMAVTGAGRGPLVRMPLDLVHGRFLPRADTLFDIADMGFDVAAEGNTVAYVEGGHQWSVWVLGLDAALAGRFGTADRRLASTSLLVGFPSRDATRLLVMREETAGRLLLVRSLAGDSTVPIRSGAGLLWAGWTPEGSVRFATVDRTGAHLFLGDPSTGGISRAVAIPDSGLQAFVALPDSGWAWVPLSQRSIRVMRRGETAPRDYPAPAGVRLLLSLQVTMHGGALVAEGVRADGGLVVYTLSIPEGRITTLARLDGPVFNVRGDRLADGSFLIDVWSTVDLVSLYRLAEGAGGQWRMQPLGTIPRSVAMVQSTLDGRTLAVTTREFQGDIWIARRAGSGR